MTASQPKKNKQYGHRVYRSGNLNQNTVISGESFIKQSASVFISMVVLSDPMSAYNMQTIELSNSTSCFMHSSHFMLFGIFAVVILVQLVNQLHRLQTKTVLKHQMHGQFLRGVFKRVCDYKHSNIIYYHLKNICWHRRDYCGISARFNNLLGTTMTSNMQVMMSGKLNFFLAKYLMCTYIIKLMPIAVLDV